jgi:hypothetical protein
MLSGENVLGLWKVTPALSDQHMTLYPSMPDKTNEGSMQTLTKEELKKKGLKV